MAQTAGSTASVHVLKVTLRDVRPSVWRRLEVPSAYTLGELHEVLQPVFGWQDDHLHDFTVRGTRYTSRQLIGELMSPWGGDEPRDEDRALLAMVAPRPGDVVDYTYDFGDDWQHRIEVEKVIEAAPDAWYPSCTAGSGLSPEEDTGRVRAGRFDDRARQRLNGLLRRAFAVSGRQLPTDDVVIDPVFSGLFPDLSEDGSGECPCGCGELGGPAAAGMLPVLHLPPDQELADLAAGTSLARRVVALAGWVGTERALTPSRVLRPADAVRAVDDLDLAVDDPASVSAWPRPPRWSGQRERSTAVRSAKNLPSLHPLWLAALAAGLIEIRGSKAYPGPELAVWQQPASPQARLESWAKMLAGFLRARDEAAHSNRSVRTRSRGQMLQASIPLLYALAQDPVPSGVLGLGLAELDDGLGPVGLMMLPLLMTDLSAVIEDWAGAGVVGIGTATENPAAQAFRAQLDQLEAELGQELAAIAHDSGSEETAEEIRSSFDAALELLLEGPTLLLTPLGRYALARLLVAHGWVVPVPGACADLAPADLLDQLAGYNPRDVLDEARGWLDARGEDWAEALREVLTSAAVTGEAGPSRRGVLPGLLIAAGPQAAPVLESVQGDPALSAVVALIRDLLGIGPALTLDQRLWLAVDGLSMDVDDPDDFEQELANSPLPDLLAGPGGVAAAAGLNHPRAREVLRAALPHLPDPQLARALTKALTGGQNGHPALRVVGGRGSGRQPGRKPTRRRR